MNKRALAVLLLAALLAGAVVVSRAVGVGVFDGIARAVSRAVEGGANQ